MVIVALMGRSGGGKSTTEKQLEIMGYHRIVSYTDRAKRGNEENHREYNFVTEDEFDKLIEHDMLVEWALYNNHRYGSPKAIGYDRYVIVVETDGYLKLKEIYGDQVIGVYIDTPKDVISKRLKNRGDTPDEVAKQRDSEDDLKFENIKKLVDLVVNGDAQLVDIVAQIITEVKKRQL